VGHQGRLLDVGRHGEREAQRYDHKQAKEVELFHAIFLEGDVSVMSLSDGQL
jgi:hypothetical protein